MLAHGNQDESIHYGIKIFILRMRNLEKLLHWRFTSVYNEHFCCCINNLIAFNKVIYIKGTICYLSDSAMKNSSGFSYQGQRNAAPDGSEHCRPTRPTCAPCSLFRLHHGFHGFHSYLCFPKNLDLQTLLPSWQTLKRARRISFMCKRNVDRDFPIKFGGKLLTYKVIWISENHLNFLHPCTLTCNMRGIAQNCS